MLLRGNDLVVFGIIQYGAELCIDDVDSEAGLREAKAQAYYAAIRNLKAHDRPCTINCVVQLLHTKKGVFADVKFQLLVHDCHLETPAIHFTMYTIGSSASILEARS